MQVDLQVGANERFSGVSELFLRAWKLILLKHKFKIRGKGDGGKWVGGGEGI